MKFQEVLFLTLAVVCGVAADDMGDDLLDGLNGTDDGLDGLLDSLNYTAPSGDDDFWNSTWEFPCEAETIALDACVVNNSCDEACEGIIGDDDDGYDDDGDDVFSNFDPSNTTAIKDAVMASWGKSCETSKEEVCLAEQCCPVCVEVYTAALACLTNETIGVLENQVSDILGGVGDVVDGLLGALNDFTSEALNETIAPTGGLDGLGDLFSGLTCDYENVKCPKPDGMANGTDVADPEEAVSAAEAKSGETASAEKEPAMTEDLEPAKVFMSGAQSASVLFTVAALVGIMLTGN
ncbi:expressed unknown protein [Seminavis robusta]|uniref:Uncharacterized protein n=1 Tax=Seminavis robusta TaxID=568900 RepID=A0A9N8HMG1_9STRA|nr:expressed unknown protein [Seminavis robusta]|eukprot:Sro742_g195920.1 n/a (294) ;mRNA; f:24107-24988